MKQPKLIRVLTQLEKDMSNFAKKKSSTRTANYLSGRLTSLETSMVSAESVYEGCIGSLSDGEDDKCSELEEVYDKIRELYFDYRADLLDALDKAKAKENKVNVTEAGANITISTHNSDIKLKNIPVPAFSGNYESWRGFRDLFVSLVHHNSSLSEIQKMHYLKTSVSGEAEKILSHLSISNGNYVKAWAILQDRYDHQRFLVNTQLKCFFNQPSINQERSEAIKELLDTSTEIIHSLESFKVPVEHCDVMLIYVLLQKLPPKTQQLWEEKLGSKENTKELPTFAEFKQFLETRFRTLEAVNYQQGKTSLEPSKKVPNRNCFHAQTTTSKFTCKLCNKGQHSIRKCHRFLKMSINDRSQAILKLGLCRNCFAYSHLSDSCPSTRRCYYCQQPHHSLLHNSSLQNSHLSNPIPSKAISYKNSYEQNKGDVTSINPNAPSFRPSNIDQGASTHRDVPNGDHPCSSKSINTYHSVPHTNTRVMLATAIVKVIGTSGEVVSLRALLDSGSEASFITESAVQLLRLSHKSTFVEVSGLGMVNSGTCNKIVDISIGSYHSEFAVNTQALVYKSLCGHIPAQTFPVVDWTHLDGLKLADPFFFKPGKVDLLLGSDVLADILLPELARPNQANLPLAQNTKLGWIVFGRASIALHSVQSLHQTCNLDNNMRQFWELEEAPFQNVETPENVACEEHFLKNVKRLADGRCKVALPFKGNVYPVLGRSKEGALQRFKQLEGRSSKNPDFHRKYSECIQDYLRMGHMSEVDDHMLEDTPHCFLPHHAVIKESSSSTKLRVVFDASFKTSDGSSLNDMLMTGPALQNNIIDVILRWRLYRYTFTADIKQMYRQIWVSENDSYYQLILWRSDPSEPIKVYRLKTVTFGTASAPYLAIRTLNWLAEKARPVFPRAARMIREEMYVDDLISGADTIEEAEIKIREVKQILGAAGLVLRKWTTNNESLLREVPVEERETTFAFPSDNSEQLKMLGIHWNPTLDSFLYSYVPPTHPQTTKRSILSTIAKLFDPMGWISPCVIKAKCFLQLLWAKKLTWDEPVDEELRRNWNVFFEDLEAINQIRLPRWVQSGQHFKKVEIHGFSDASEKAFGAAVYIRVLDEQDSVHMNLLLSKTRVAPLKPVSIPRLELCGAVMLARLLNHATNILNLTEAKIHAWTDSTITLCWILSSPSRLETFVANRVGEIQRLTDSSIWKHIPTEQNPADRASRGVLPSALIQEHLWWKGPKFLHTSWDFILPTQPINLMTEEGQKRTRCLRLEAEDNQILLLINKTSSFQKLVRIVAYCKKFINISRQNHNKFCYFARSLQKHNTVGIPFSAKELDEATANVIWVAQQQMFPDGITKTRGMASLNPFVDGYGVIRVGGRLSQANIPYDQQHPYILDPNNKLSQLIIRDAHIKTLHGGIQLMMAHLRNKFWIFKLKSAVKKHVHNCVTCYRFRAQKSHQLMGELPAPRVSISKPFTHTGIDYAGPINIRSWKGRGAKCYKGYLAIFICLATKALHLEAVSDLTTQAFLAAYRRFAARRGVCAQIYSDCGTNFVGADSELRRLLKNGIQDFHHIANVLATEGTQWNFIPPASPHFGGLWEAGVKSVKFHLKRIVGNGTLTYEELTTLLTQVEACLNSRPLCPLTEDPADFQALTPAHFLIGQNIFTVPEGDLTFRKQNLVDRWKTIQVHLQTFWNQWQTEYLSRLQQRPKWLKPQPQLKRDDLVLIRDERLPPTKWSLGRIVATYPGADNITRVVQVKTSQGEFRRPITKLCPLPCNDVHSSST